MISDALRHPEAAIEAAFVQVVEEDAAYAARLGTVLDIEVFVAPALEARVEICPERLQGLTACAVEVARVLLEPVIRREVHPAAEPPYRLAARLGRDQEAHVH